MNKAMEMIADLAGSYRQSMRECSSGGNGALKKKLGIVIASAKVEGQGRIYRVTDHG